MADSAVGGETASGLASLIARIKQDGVQAGERERAAQVEAARAEATAIVEAARQQAHGIRAAAEADAQQRRAQLDAELRMAARDFAFRFRERLASQVVAKVTDAAAVATLGDDAALAALVAALLADRSRGARVAVDPALRARLVAALGARVAQRVEQGGVELRDEAGLGGFRLVRAGEHFVWDVTQDAVARELAQLVGADLAAAFAGPVADHAGAT